MVADADVTFTGTWEKSVTTSKIKQDEPKKTPTPKASPKSSPREKVVKTGASSSLLLLIAGASSILGALVLVVRRAQN